MADTDWFSDQEVVAKTIWGEARGEGDIGMQAVANAIRNRVNSGTTWWGHDFRTVCLKPFQFSCWLRSDPNRPLLLIANNQDHGYPEAMDIANRAMDGSLPDLTDGAVNYFSTSMPRAPAWADGKIPSAIIGKHIFFT